MPRRGVLVIVIIFLFGYCNQIAYGFNFDSTIQNLKLVKLITGDDAIEDVNRLHGTQINVVSAYIAYYEGEKDKATIWVSEASSQKHAQSQLDVMIQKMKNNPRSPFNHYRNLERKGFSIIAFDGIGQVHYVFRDNKWVFWISANTYQMKVIFDHIVKNR